MAQIAVTITNEERRELKRLARKKGTSVAQLVRDSLPTRSEDVKIDGLVELPQEPVVAAPQEHTGEAPVPAADASPLPEIDRGFDSPDGSTQSAPPETGSQWVDKQVASQQSSMVAGVDPRAVTVPKITPEVLIERGRLTAEQAVHYAGLHEKGEYSVEALEGICGCQLPEFKEE